MCKLNISSAASCSFHYKDSSSCVVRNKHLLPVIVRFCCFHTLHHPSCTSVSLARCLNRTPVLQDIFFFSTQQGRICLISSAALYLYSWRIFSEYVGGCYRCGKKTKKTKEEKHREWEKGGLEVVINRVGWGDVWGGAMINQVPD